jgi:hypothetical protein
VGSDLVLRKYEASWVDGTEEGGTPVIAGDAEGEDGAKGDAIEEADVLFARGGWRVEGGGGPTRDLCRTDLGGITADGTKCLSLSNSSGGGGEVEEGSKEEAVVDDTEVGVVGAEVEDAGVVRCNGTVGGERGECRGEGAG